MNWLRRGLNRVMDRDATPPAQQPELFPPGHFYSPVPDITKVRADAARIFDRDRRDLPGVDLRESAQLELLEQFVPFYKELPFAPTTSPGLRYHYENDFFSYGDAIFLYSMLRVLRPKRLVEVGSGFSSAVVLDTNERFLGSELDLVFVDPYAERLHTLMNDGDRARARVIERPVQEVPLEVFTSLAAGDILFIDSTHVSKIGSDVNYLFFEVLPRLQKGVYVHVHDVFYPFEYPEQWVYEGRAWNENYMLRAFLQFNGAFETRLFNGLIARFHRDWLETNMPLCLKNTGGSFWMQRVS